MKFFSFPLKLGMLTITRFTDKRTHRGHIVAEYACDCGKTGEISTANLFRPIMPARSCGCVISTVEYKTWREMKSRCLYEKHHARKDYQDRGITVCPEWLDNFWQFYKDMGPRPEGRSLDRKNNDKGYSKANCRWATDAQQMRNRRNVKLTEESVKEIRSAVGKTRIKDLAEKFGVARTTIYRVQHFQRWA